MEGENAVKVERKGIDETQLPRAILTPKYTMFITKILFPIIMIQGYFILVYGTSSNQNERIFTQHKDFNSTIQMQRTFALSYNSHVYYPYYIFNINQLIH